MSKNLVCLIRTGARVRVRTREELIVAKLPTE
jgi:hypothetical protein